MKLYAIHIKPASGFGTGLKGDTLFGHFCWQAAYDGSLVEGGLERQIAAYPEKPFAVFSSAFPVLKNGDKKTYVLKRPDLPFSFMLPAVKDKAENIRRKKEFKKKKWMLVGKNLRPDVKTAEFISNDTLLDKAFNQLPSAALRQLRKAESPGFIKVYSQSHNTINRLTQTTGKGMFAPYTTENHYYFPEALLAVFVLVDTSATDIDRIRLGFDRIGKWGFGRDASTGLGRFSVDEVKELEPQLSVDATACYTLAPCVPEKGAFKECFFTPFVRYGKHGDRLATHANPFKNPVIMADEGAVFVPQHKDLIGKPFVGRAVTGISKAMPETVVQGYAPCLPLKLEI